MRQFGCLGDSLIQVAHLVHQSQTLSILAQPYAAFADSFDRVLGHVASLGAARGEEVVTALYHALHESRLLGVHALVYHVSLQRRVAIGFQTVDVQSDLVAQFVDVGHEAKDTDRTGEGGRFSVDIVGTAGDIVTSRSGQVTHRDHDRQALLTKRLESTPYLFAGIGATAGTVDTQHDGLNLVVLGDLANGLDQVFAHDAIPLTVGNLALCVDDGYLAIGFLLGSCDGCQFGGRDLLIVLYTGIDTQQAIHLMGIYQGIHETVLQEFLLGLQTHVLIGIRIEAIGRETTRLGYAGYHLVPNTAHVGHGLQTVSLRHVGAEEGLDSRLERTDLQYLHLHTYLVQNAGVVHLLGRESVPVHLAHGVEAYAVGHGSDIVVHLAITIGIGQYPLAGLLKVQQRLAYLLGSGLSYRQLATAEVDTQYSVILFGQTYVAQYLVQPDGLLLGIHAGTGHLAQHFGPRVARTSLLYHGTPHIEAIDGVLLQLHFRRREHITKQHTHQAAQHHVDNECPQAAAQAAKTAGTNLRLLLTVFSIGHRFSFNLNKTHSIWLFIHFHIFSFHPTTND